MDTSDPAITFDDAGVCSHCRRAVRQLAAVRWTQQHSDLALAAMADRIRAAGVGREYDCVIGLSGGVDSSFAAVVAGRLGLRPLAVHFDNGWNTELAVENIQRIVEGCGFDLHTEVIDWREFRDLQCAFLEASVVDIELLTDHAILASMSGLARKHGIRFVVSGNNVATEHGMPLAWVWNKLDWTNIRSIHRAFGRVPLRSFPHTSTAQWTAMQLTGRLIIVEPLNLMNYRRDEAAAILSRDFGWREYGGKHHESAFTKFYQGAILPRKFGIDKRRVHYSDRVRNGELTRAAALALLAEPLYRPDELRIEGDYVRKKLGFNDAAWESMLASPPRSHADFASDRRIATLITWLVRIERRVRRALKQVLPR